MKAFLFYDAITGILHKRFCICAILIKFNIYNIYRVFFNLTSISKIESLIK